MFGMAPQGRRAPVRIPTAASASAAVLLLAGVLIWQSVTQHGSPDPTNHHLTLAAAVVDTGILVFRQGLEATLVLAAICASLGQSGPLDGRAVFWGVGAALAATVVTWYMLLAALAAVDAPALDVLAATGVVAVAVLLVVMNWFVHRVYWTGWISRHARTSRALLGASGRAPALLWRGLALLGFTATYREGFETVVLLQNIRLQVGHQATLIGAGIGVGLTLITAVLTFFAQHRLPYRRVLVATGVMLGGVLVLMVGETVEQMQAAGWIPASPLHLPVPAWAGVWFSVYPNAEGLAAQAAAAALVLGSYWAVRYGRVPRVGPHAASATWGYAVASGRGRETGSAPRAAR